MGQRANSSGVYIVLIVSIYYVRIYIVLCEQVLNYSVMHSDGKLRVKSVASDHEEAGVDVYLLGTSMCIMLQVPVSLYL